MTTTPHTQTQRHTYIYKGTVVVCMHLLLYLFTHPGIPSPASISPRTCFDSFVFPLGIKRNVDVVNRAAVCSSFIFPCLIYLIRRTCIICTLFLFLSLFYLHDSLNPPLLFALSLTHTHTRDWEPPTLCSPPLSFVFCAIMMFITYLIHASPSFES